MFDFNDYELTVEEFYDSLLNDDFIEIDYSYINDCMNIARNFEKTFFEEKQK